MPDMLEYTIDKFTFRVATDRWYNAAGVWARPESDGVRIGLSDYRQQSSGDVAFASVRRPGTVVGVGDDIADIETIKANVGLPSPVAGTVTEMNAALEETPELINQDPYGAGWLAVVDAGAWADDQARLLEAAGYFELMQRQAEEEARQG